MKGENNANAKVLFRTLEEIKKLVAAFESCTLPREQWNHRAHLTVALWYLSRHSQATATNLIRRNILRHLDAHGIVTTKDSGYHETITLFFMHVVSEHLSEATVRESLVMLTNKLIETCKDKNLPLEYYSKERLMSWEARTRWVKPDLKPLAQRLDSPL